MIRVRAAQVDDAEALLEIYRPIIAHSWTSFETEAPSLAEWQARISRTMEQRPWLVANIDEQIAGYAYASGHRSRSAYQWCSEVSVYVHEAHRRKGVAARLYGALLRILSHQGYANAYAGITLPNDASIATHTRLGFSLIGIYQKVGFKLGAWRDVAWYERELVRDNPPVAPVPFSSLGHDVVAALSSEGGSL